jgi:stage II sporulation protein D
MRRSVFTATLGVCALLLSTLPASAGARDRWSLRGAGWGHGVGMSQYGAYGYARHGRGYREILTHYYQGTRIVQRPPTLVRVLLQANRSTVSFTGATSAGDRRLTEDSVYKATRDGENVVLESAGGKPLRTYSGLLSVSGGDTVRLLGQAGNGVRDGLYRGSLDIRAAAADGLNAINTLPMEDYLAGVVPSESPPIWPLAALQAQAVAARSYALTTNVGGKGFDQYPDTRSQVYRGFGAETASTSNAVASTAGEVVMYGGEVAVTYFFSTSGGHTENVENVFTHSDPRPWLQGVDDPYDDASPYHRWGPFSFSTRGLDAKLGDYSKGRFRKLQVLARGVSPRIVRARVIGSRGSAIVTGSQLRARLDLRDSWLFLRRVSTDTGETGGTQARTSSGTHDSTAIYGDVDPIRARFVMLERFVDGKWIKDSKWPLSQHGARASYRFHISKPGRYRVLAGWAPGPTFEIKK